MNQNFTFALLTSIFLTGLTSCDNNSAKNEPLVTEAIQPKAISISSAKVTDNIFENPSALTAALSQNGIGKLKEWSNPMEMGWSSMTDYYQFGNKKDGVGMQNNIAYYLEGDETTAKALTINLNINNPLDKKNALKFLSEVSVKTFKSLNLEPPNGLTKAILSSKTFNADISTFTTSVESEKSKIETWKVSIVKK